MGPEFEDQVAEEEAMNGETWTNYEFQPAPRDLLCQFRRPGLNLVWVGYGRNIYLSSYATDLQWRLTGIAREALDRMPTEMWPTGMLPGLLGQVADGCFQRNRLANFK